MKQERIEFRSFMNVAYDDLLKVNHIGFGRQMLNVQFEGLNIFKEEPMLVLKNLSLKDGKPYFYLGSVVFLNLGISTTGFYEDDISKKAISLFKKGAWDKRISKMKPISL